MSVPVYLNMHMSTRKDQRGQWPKDNSLSSLSKSGGHRPRHG